jgi:membrane fusion protein (multidrug efflux system)
MNTWKHRSNRGVFLAALLLLAVGAAGCSHSSAGSDEESSANAVAEVTLTKVERADITEMLTITGTIAALPNQDVRVSSLVAGRIAELSVAEGDRVSAGKIIARIDDRPFRDQLHQSEAAAAQARANLENSRLNRARDEDLFSRGIAARKEVEDVRTQEKVAEAGLRQAEAALSLVRLQLARTEIHAPLSGMVVKRYVNVGEQVDGTGTQPIVEVASSGEVELLGNVPAAYLRKIHAGETLRIASDAAPGNIFSGRVVALSPAVDAATNAGLMRVRLDNRLGLLRLGMVLSARVPIATHAAVLSVPPQAIYRDEQGRPRIFKVENEKATATEVKIGIETQERVEVLDGVREGEAVILTGGYGLSETSMIRVKGSAKEPGKP